MPQQTDPPKTLDEAFSQLSQQITDLSREVERSNEKFDLYQKSTQWVVQLAFSLIAAATVVTLASAIFKR
jgi:hypothetical protein